MIISETKKFIFGGIGRSAATSLHVALRKYNDYRVGKVKSQFHPAVFSKNKNKKFPFRKHAPFRVAKACVPEFDEYFKFCIFRNPWDLIVSKYFYHRGDKCRRKNSFFCRNARNMSFLEWARDERHYSLLYELPIQTFREFVSDEGGEQYQVTVYNFSHLDRMVADLNERGINVTLSRENATRHEHYSRYYQGDSEIINKIRDHFSWGVDLFGFKFNTTGSVFKVSL